MRDGVKVARLAHTQETVVRIHLAPLLTKKKHIMRFDIAIVNRFSKANASSRYLTISHWLCFLLVRASNIKDGYLIG